MPDAAPLPDEAAAEALFAALRWPESPVCPTCGTAEAYRLNITGIRRWRYKCRRCRRQFSVTRGTILEGSKLSLAAWQYLIQDLCARPEGISIGYIQRTLGLSHGAARNVYDRLLYALARPPLRSLVAHTVSEGREPP